jgi:hypothetical protein
MSRLLENWQDGGWGMWFLLVFGALAVTSAARFAWKGDHRLRAFILWMAVTTLASSALSFATGMIKVLGYVAHPSDPEQRLVILVEGTKEALNCITFGLMLVTLTTLLVAIGYRRYPTSEAA